MRHRYSALEQFLGVMALVALASSINELLEHPLRGRLPRQDGNP
jgi:hypothetical protein